jgi:DNA polymerase-3 subunit delta'
MSAEPQPDQFLPLADLLGQDRAMGVLTGALDANRVHHAWIFAGPSGVGKCTAALAFAAILLDPDAGPNLVGQFESDPHGQTAQLIRAGTHPDLHIIRKELAAFADDRALRERKQRSIPIELIRTLMIRVAWQKPTLNHAKVFIIDEAELLAPPAQNAILKTLEEPPPNTYVILVTSSEDRLLPTIRSRSQRAVFNRLGPDAMRTWLARTDLDPTSAQQGWIDRFAQGSPGRARLAIETGICDWLPLIEPLTHPGRFDPASGQALAKQIDEWAAAWVKAHPGASKEAANRAGTQHMLSMLAESQRGALSQANTDAARHRAVRAVELVTRAETQANSNVNLQFVMENLAASLASC